MIKNFVLDTNIVLSDPQAIFRFEDNNVVLPITVLEELDKFKRDLNELGRNSREVARLIDAFRDHGGNLHKGVPMDSGGKLRVMTNLGKEPPLPFPSLSKNADSMILATALLLKKREELPVVFVTRDINLRLRADAVGLRAVNYEEPDSVTVDEMYSGHREYPVTTAQIRRFKTNGKILATNNGLFPNQCMTLISTGRVEQTAMARYDSSKRSINAVWGKNDEIWGIKPRNEEQQFALDLLMDDSIPLVTLSGKAGTGKTLLAIAAGLQKVVDDKEYSKLVISRPVMPLGREIGFLPGSMGEKMQPWMEPVNDNLELLIELKIQSQKEAIASGRVTAKKKRAKNPKEDMLRGIRESGILEVQPLTYIRGRSLPRQFLVIDEAQNLSQHEVKTIITRAGEGTKVVLTGDPYQIDNPFLDTTSNGLSITVERFKQEKIAGHITLVRGERSELSELASNLL